MSALSSQSTFVLVQSSPEIDHTKLSIGKLIYYIDRYIF